MAARNAENHIGEALVSLLDQTLDDFEIIVVDDASTDSTAAVAEALDDVRIRLIRLPDNRGAAGARNAGLRAALGQYVAIQDADDVSRPDRLARQLAYLKEHPRVDVLGAQIRVIDDDGEAVGRREYPTGHAAIMRVMPRWNPIAHSTVMTRTDLVIRAGGYPERMRAAHDYALWAELAGRGAVFANLPATLVGYRIHRDTIKTTQVYETLRNTLAVQRAYWGDSARPADRLYRAAENTLLLLPPGFSIGVFRLVRYRLPMLAAFIRSRLAPREGSRESPT